MVQSAKLIMWEILQSKWLGILNNNNNMADRNKRMAKLRTLATPNTQENVNNRNPYLLLVEFKML